MSTQRKQPIAVGPFDLEAPLGFGGMAEVWRGLHRAQGVPVAVKIINASVVKTPRFAEAFRNEVRAMAGLDHPNIAMIFDYGELTETIDVASGGRLVAGSVYLAMELASGGSLGQLSGILRWSQLKRVLLSLLDALAHAHARGVVHLDLKPENVLIATEADAVPGLKLTDFGIAHAFKQQLTKEGGIHPQWTQPKAPVDASASIIAGTPNYMAPEQFLADWRDFGPWTDLYALGCLGYTLTTGAPPFRDVSGLLLAEAHYKDSPPPLRPCQATPPGFTVWVTRLLAKSPRDRFQCAADAAIALEQLPPCPDRLLTTLDQGSLNETPLSGKLPQRYALRDGLDETPLSGVLPQRDALRDGLDETPLSGVLPERYSVRHTLAIDLSRLEPPTDAEPDPDEEVTDGRAASPVPVSWRMKAPPARALSLIGAGLGLYGLRSIPLVGRDEERDRIWAALREVARQRRPRALMVTGASGLGRSRLVEWMTDRAHELGAATVLKACHQVTPTPADGLGPMLNRHLRCAGLSSEGVAQRARTWLAERGLQDEYEWQALAELLVPERMFGEGESRFSASTHLISFESMAERFATLRRFLALAAQERPLMVWFEDVQWGLEAVAFVHDIMAHPETFRNPVLFLMTVQDEAIVERVLESRALAKLRRLPGVMALPLGPLTHEEHVGLVERLLGMEHGLAQEVAWRTRGNPLFAVQLVGDWVQRKVLTLSADGFVLRPGEAALLPDTIHDIWMARVARALENEPPDALHMFELAAVLGQSVDEDEWGAVCEIAGIALSFRVLDVFLANKLMIHAGGNGPPSAGQRPSWSFVHGMLRESLARSARDAGRWRAHNRCCITMLLEQRGQEQRHLDERLGQHCLAAKQLGEAAVWLLRAATVRREDHDPVGAHLLLEWRDTALTELGVPLSDPRWGDGWLLASRLFLDQGRPDEAAQKAEEALAAARIHGWERVLPHALLELSRVLQYRGEMRRSEGPLEEALGPLRTLDDIVGVAHCLRGLARVAEARDEATEASRLFTQALERYRQTGQVRLEVACLNCLGRLALRREQGVAASGFFKQALRLAASESFQSGLAEALEGLSRVAFTIQGDMAGAMDYLEKAAAILRRIDHRLGLAEVINRQGELARAEGDLVAATAYYQEALRLCEALGSGQGDAPRLNLGITLLARGAFDEAHEVLTGAVETLETTGRHRLVGAFHLALLACMVHRQDWLGWATHLRAAALFYEQDGLTTTDDLWLIELAGERTRVARPRLARDAYRLALRLAEALGDEARTAALIHTLAELERRLGEADLSG